jgi:hypothetical protein
MKTATCPKCDGKKHIDGFGHVANGVCFRCNGAGVVKACTVKAPPPATAYQVKCAEWILNVTEETMATLTYGQLLKARDFAHWPLVGYPNLLKVWFAKCEAFFQAKQEEMLVAC